jgi:hypothetical protein
MARNPLVIRRAARSRKRCRKAAGAEVAATADRTPDQRGIRPRKGRGLSFGAIVTSPHPYGRKDQRPLSPGINGPEWRGNQLAWPQNWMARLSQGDDVAEKSDSQGRVLPGNERCGNAAVKEA